MAKKPLEVGQKVWIETNRVFYMRKDECRTIAEYEIVETNKSSAYAVSESNLKEYKEDTTRNAYMRRRINQKSHEIAEGYSFGYAERLWLDEHSFHQDVERVEMMKSLQEEAIRLVRGMTDIVDLKALVRELVKKWGE